MIKYIIFTVFFTLSAGMIFYNLLMRGISDNISSLSDCLNDYVDHWKERIDHRVNIQSITDEARLYGAQRDIYKRIVEEYMNFGDHNISSNDEFFYYNDRMWKRVNITLEDNTTDVSKLTVEFTPIITED